MALFAFLDQAEDLQWLHDVHGVDVEGVVAAEIYGNEDSPRYVRTYDRDDYRCTPMTWALDAAGRLVRCTCSWADAPTVSRHHDGDCSINVRREEQACPEGR